MAMITVEHLNKRSAPVQINGQSARQCAVHGRSADLRHDAALPAGDARRGSTAKLTSRLPRFCYDANLKCYVLRQNKVHSTTSVKEHVTTGISKWAIDLHAARSCSGIGVSSNVHTCNIVNAHVVSLISSSASCCFSRRSIKRQTLPTSRSNNNCLHDCALKRQQADCTSRKPHTAKDRLCR